MVERVTPTAATAASEATRVNHSVSLAEPDIAWAAARQSAINAGLARENAMHPASEPLSSGQDGDDHDLADRHLDHHRRPDVCIVPEDEHPSGESDRIGSGNLDDDVPFGEHVGFV